MRLRLAATTVIIGVALLGAGCSSGESASEETTPPSVASSTTTTVAPTTTTSSTTATTTVAPTTTTSSAPAELTVEVNGAHLSYECRGEGSPTVVVELGLFDSTHAERDPNWMSWGNTLDMIAETNKVCIYGRRGMFGSEPVSAEPPRTTQDQVDDLNDLIDALELETPVILVAHSLGGYNIRLFAGQHPENVAGLVFVDATEPGILEFGPGFDPFPPEWIDIVTSSAQVASVTDLGNLPVYVLTATVIDPDSPFSDNPDWWFGLQDNLLALSTNSTQTKVEATHPDIYWAEPETVVEAVAWVTAQAG